MSHYKPYPAYKESGIEWIGEVPKHWEISPFFTVAKELSRSNKGMIESKVLSLSYGRIIPKRESENLGLVPDSYETYQIVEPGEIVFRFTDLQNDKNSLRSAQVKERGIITSAYLATKASNINETYLAWLMRAYDHCKVFYALGGGLRQSLKYSDVKRLPVVVPPLVEQCRSVSLIDRETARIDSLIAKKTEFIELLAKKRQALITHAVTKGLNPKAQMKESGVEWIGSIPDHWLVAQLGKIAIARCDGPFGSGLKSEHYQSDGVRVIRLQNIGWASFKDGNEAFISHEHWQDVLGCGHEVLPDDVLIGGLGDDKNPLGRACVAPANLGPAMVKADCYRFRLNTNRVLPEFVALALSATARSECGYLATGATRDRLNLGLASARVVPLPPRNEQVDIVASLNRDASRIDLLTDKTQLSIDLLKKRRSALITAAVTGQIDLRESA